MGLVHLQSSQYMLEPNNDCCLQMFTLVVVIELIEGNSPFLISRVLNNSQFAHNSDSGIDLIPILSSRTSYVQCVVIENTHTHTSSVTARLFPIELHMFVHSPLMEIVYADMCM